MVRQRRALVWLNSRCRRLSDLAATASGWRSVSTTLAAPGQQQPQGPPLGQQLRNDEPASPTGATSTSAASAPRTGARLSLAVPAFSVWGANTNVGKTLVSVGLAHAASALQVSLAYVKPVQTGFPEDSDARLVALACGGQLSMGPHAAKAAEQAGADAGGGGGGTTSASGRETRPGALARCTTLFAWRHAVSPHLAVRLEGRAVSDEELAAATAVHVQQEMDELQLRAPAAPSSAGGGDCSLATADAGGAASVGGSSGAGAAGPGASTAARGGGGGGALLLLETAGGVTSPAPSGRLACDVLRPLRLPAVLVGDPRLGGIAATLSAYDSLVARGWDVEAIVLVGQHTAQQVPSFGGTAGGAAAAVPLDNLSFLKEHFSGAAAAVHRLGAPPPEVVGVPACPPPPQGHNVRAHGLDPGMCAWLDASRPAFSDLLAALQGRHLARVGRLLAGRAAAEAQLWWPFTQHAGLTHGSATVVDGRCGETWTALAAPPPPEAAAAAAPPLPPALVPLYDASGSWWTQAATPALQPEIARAVSYAAGRYLHVLFAEVAHEPALRAAAALLSGPGAGWASRVFFSDDGSTAIEVALKMAFRKFLADRGELEAAPDGGAPASAAAASAASGGGGGELLVLGLHGAYHGDTLGAQDCVAPSVFNGPLQSPWYRGRGLFLEPPYVGMRQGRWRILDPPSWLRSRTQAAANAAAAAAGKLPTWGSLEEVMSYGRAGGGAAAAELATAYRSYIESAMDEFEASAAAAAAGGGAASRPARLAACIMEPLLQGAGGMLVVEPGFQRAMAEVCRSRGLPLILDEVFSGLYRTGALTAAAALDITPDVAAYGKLLTGGAAPMAVTLASEDVFRAFSGPSKLFALLHGHSYTAYPVGCAAAVASLELLSNPDTNPNVCSPCRCPKTPACTSPCGRLLPLWDEQGEVSELSYHPLVSRVAAVGTVLAVELTAGGGGGGGGSGYGSVSAVQVVRRLRDAYGIYARPLGSVVYLMVPPTAPRETAAWLAASLKAALDWCAAAAAAAAGGSQDGGGGGASAASAASAAAARGGEEGVVV